MMDQPSFEREINAYLLDVDAVLKSKGLFYDKGSAKLNLIQQEVDMTLDKLRAMQRERKLTRVSAGGLSSDSIKRVTVLSDQLLDGANVPFGAIFGSANNDSIFTVPEWKTAFTTVSGAVSNFTNTYGILISNMDKTSRTKIDQALASIIDNAQVAFDQDQSASGASRYLTASMQTIKNLEASAQTQQTQSAAGMLELTVKEKDQERIRLLSSMKIIERTLTAEQISVVNDANRRVLEKLDDILKSQTSYDAAIRNKKLQLVDSDLDIMRMTIQNQSFASRLGKALPPPRNNATKLGYLNKYKMIEDFRYAPASNLGGGLGVSFKHIENIQEASPYEILATVKHNAGVIKSQGAISVDERPIFMRQVNSLTKEAFGNNPVALKQAKTHYHSLLKYTNVGNLTLKQIEDKHPKGTKKTHIEAMHKNMQEGMEFGPAHDKAVKDGFPAGNLNGVFTFDNPTLAAPNIVRLAGSLVLYLAIPATVIYLVGSRQAAKNNPLNKLLANEEE
jgi:hypothetical protein